MKIVKIIKEVSRSKTKKKIKRKKMGDKTTNVYNFSSVSPTLKVVTTLANNYVPGAYALINSLIKNGCVNFDVTVLCYEHIDEEGVRLLKGLGVPLNFIYYKDLGESYRPKIAVDRLKMNTQKTLIWKIDWDGPMLYLDSDIICLSSIEKSLSWDEFTVAKYNESDSFNSGVFCFRPSLETYKVINGVAASHTESINLGDQITLNNVFRPSIKGPLHHKFRQVGYSWNVKGDKMYFYEGKIPIKFLHFHSHEKPWKDGPYMRKPSASEEAQRLKGIQRKRRERTWEEWKKYGP